MPDFDIYMDQFLTFNNPLFIAALTSVIIILIVIFIFIKVILPMQKRMVSENQRYLLEKAELMALFGELDPDPLIRIDEKGEIIHTNESARSLFPQENLQNEPIETFIPKLAMLLDMNLNESVLEIGGKIYSVNIKKMEGIGFTNIYLHDITKMKRYEYELESYRNSLLSLSNELEAKYHDLKNTLSAELHDDIGQKLIILRLKVSNADKYQTSEILLDIETVYQRIRELSKSLVPIEINTLGLELSLQSIIQNISQVSGIIGRLQFSYDVDDNAVVENFIIHFVQETLNNIIKHSEAKEFLVSVTGDEEYSTVSVGDNGKGFPDENSIIGSDNNSRDGLGLLRIKERINRLGGSFSIESNPKYKTNIIARIPVDEGANETD